MSHGLGLTDDQDEKFGHPFEPYHIQLEFMKTLYEVLDNSQIGIFESPTGTGKSLSLICGAMTWLRNDVTHSSETHDMQTDMLYHPRASKTDAVDSLTPDWLLEFDAMKAKNEQLADLKHMLIQLAKIRQTKHVKPGTQIREIKRIKRMDNRIKQDEDEFLLEDYEGDTQTSGPAQAQSGASIFSEEVLKLLNDTNYSAVVPSREVVEGYPVTRKIFFCSRTHSQLNQFAAEVRKPHFRNPEGLGLPRDQTEPARYVALASRKNLCINAEVSQLPLEMLNDTCLDLQDSKTPQHKKCRFLSKDAERSLQFRDRVLSEVRDIEDLAELGSSLGLCPYYATRTAIPASELVTMPYPLLLNKQARSSLGIDLTNNIVIIDEAHNLVDTITDLSSAMLYFDQLSIAREQILSYVNKYGKRLSGKNKVYITQLQRLLDSIITFLATNPAESQITLSQLLVKGSDSINTQALIAYLQQSKLARKAEAFYAAHLKAASDSAMYAYQHAVGLSSFQRFLECMSNPSKEGRLFVQKDEEGKFVLRYMLLDPANAFADIVSDARSIILAGGTMQPIDDIVELLFESEKGRVRTLSCGHIIPKENLVAMTVTMGPTNIPLEFTFEKRYNKVMLGDFGRLLNNLGGIIPDGIVVFFTSYEYMTHVLHVLEEGGQLQSLAKKKPIYVESKALTVEETLSEYTRSISRGKGGLLFAVMGGKMSEGINFSDALGRAVFVVGVPFPNAKTPEWQSRLDFVQSKATQRLLSQGISKTSAELAGKQATFEHFENAAMRSVNQSIGRAIRHKDDYAMIFLLDVRYNSQSLNSKLPKWILDKFDTTAQQGFGSVVRKVSQFFKSKKLQA